MSEEERIGEYERYLDGIEIFGVDERNTRNMEPDDNFPSEVFLVDLLIDASGPMFFHEKVMRECLEYYKKMILKSKAANELLISKTLFGSKIETSGYLTPENFNTEFEAYGGRKLYDAILYRRQKLINYMQKLKNGKTRIRACMIIICEGEDTASDNARSDVQQAIESLKRQDVTVAFVAVEKNAFEIAYDLGINPQNIKSVNNDENELRNVIELVTQSTLY